MLSHCFKCREKTNSKHQRALKTKPRKNNGFIKLCLIRLRLIKEEEAKGFLGSTLGKVAILGTLLI